MSQTNNQSAYIVTGPTAGIGLETAHEVAKHGTVILVGRDEGKLAAVKASIERAGGRAEVVVCDLSDLTSVRRAVIDIVALKLPVVGIVNNAGVMQSRPSKSAQGWDVSYATNHLGPFTLTEAMAPHLPDGANVVFVVSAVEDPGRKPAVMAGFRGGRYVSAEASARGEWTPGGSSVPGMDAYATSKQCELAAAMEFAREMPRLRFNAVEPGFNPATSLGRDANAVLRFIGKYVLGAIVPFMKYGSTSKRAARVITNVLLNASKHTGVYFDEKGRPMRSSALAEDPTFTARVVAETRAFLAAHV